MREGRAVRGAGAAPGIAVAAGPSNLNNILIVAGLVIGALAAGVWWFKTNSELNEKKNSIVGKQAEAQRLESIIKEVDEYTKRKESLQKRIDLINQLKLNQKGPVKVMDQISRDIPDLVWLTSMKVSGQLVTLNGKALNPNAVANFVDNLKNDPLFDEPELANLAQTVETVNAVPVNVYTFDMTFHFGPKPEPGAAGATGSTGSTSTAKK